MKAHFHPEKERFCLEFACAFNRAPLAAKSSPFVLIWSGLQPTLSVPESHRLLHVESKPRLFDHSGKERVFLEVARELNTKVYVGAARRKVLACLDLPAEDMARLTGECPLHL